MRVMLVRTQIPFMGKTKAHQETVVETADPS